MSEQRISDERIAFFLESRATVERETLWVGVLLDLRDCRAALAEAEKERDEARMKLQELEDRRDSERYDEMVGQ